MPESLSSENVSTKLQRIAELARQVRDPLTTLAHHIDHDFLKEAHRRTRKDGATGIDGVTSRTYASTLQENLEHLLHRFKAGTYRAPPVRRVHIPKGDGGSTRPIGIPTYEDKILQRAVAMVLEAVYEQEFLDCSYGFRPGRSAHQASAAVTEAVMRMNGGWVLEVDIEGFFDSIDREHLREFLAKRVRDGVIRRAIDKWLKAGVLEEGQHHRPEAGTPQGGVISPLLANVYLHEVLDVWFESTVKPRLRGSASLVRYADDFVIVFAHESDARRVMDVLPKRFGKYGLTLHPDKTRLLDFGRPSGNDSSRPKGKSFDFLGFTYHWGRSRRGKNVVRRKTASSRFTRTLKRIRAWCRENRHAPIAWQQARLTRMLRGHYAYFGVTGNIRALSRMQWEAKRAWQYWLNRRSHRAKMTWERFNRLQQRYPLPAPRIVHSIYRRAAKP